MAENWTITSVDYSEYDMQWHCSLTFISSHWLPAAEGTTSTLCMNSYPYKVLLAHFQACDVKWWGGRCIGVCGRNWGAPPILNGVLWVGQPTQVSWRSPGDPDFSWSGQWLQWDDAWGTHCSKVSDTFVMSCHVMSCSLQLACANAILGIRNLSKWYRDTHIACTITHQYRRHAAYQKHGCDKTNRKVSQSPCDPMHPLEDASPLCVVAVGSQQKSPYLSWVCASTLTVYVVAGARPVSV